MQNDVVMGRPRKRRRLRNPNMEQRMLIRKSGYDPYECMVIWEGADEFKVLHEPTRQKLTIVK